MARGSVVEVQNMGTLVRILVECRSAEAALYVRRKLTKQEMLAFLTKLLDDDTEELLRVPID
jgi:hypothetical protein